MKDNGIVKVLVKTESSYLLSLKKDPETRSDGLLEHLGGHIDPEECCFEALLREVTEEEASGKLAAVLRKEKPVPHELFVAVHGRQEKHYLYRVTISKELASQLQADERESYGFQFVAAQYLESEQGLHTIEHKLTWKTRQIHNALEKYE